MIPCVKKEPYIKLRWGGDTANITATVNIELTPKLHSLHNQGHHQQKASREFRAVLTSTSLRFAIASPENMNESNFPSNISESSYEKLSPLPTNTAPKKTKRGPRGGVYDPFPLKVHRMLEQTKTEALDSVVSWLEHGRAFKIHDPKAFVETVMPRFFNQSKFTSFQRQLNLYGKICHHAQKHSSDTSYAHILT